MAKGYLPVERDQPFLLPPDMRQWLPASHPVWLVIEAVARLDTSGFHAHRRTGGAGTAGYDPDMLVTLLVWAYANGVTSSRRIERLCSQDVAFRVVCAGRVPDHVTVARFRQRFADAAEGLFAEVLLLCARLGMGKVGTVALDGTKVAGNASLGATRAERAAQAGEKDGGKKGKEPARRNDTDPASRLMPVRGGGFIQGWNAQNVTSEDGLVIATRLTAFPNDVGCYEDMIAIAAAAAAAMATAGGSGDGAIGLVLADAGYLSERNLTCPGPDRLIATGKHRSLEKAAGPDAAGTGDGAIAAMAARLATPDGIAAYRRRSHIGETFHADLRHNQGLRRLSLRGPRKASGEWTFAAAVRNLRKAITSGHLTAQSLAALPG